MRHLRIYLFGSICCFLLMSCEGETTYFRTIVNDTDATFEFEFFSSDELLTKNITVHPNSSEDIYANAQLGGNSTAISCADIIDSVHINVIDANELLKDIMDNDNWTNLVEEEQFGSIVTQTCSFTINPIDIE